MRDSALLCVLTASLCLLGGRVSAATASNGAGRGASSQLLNWQFVGTRALAGDTNGSQLRRIASLPSSQSLLNGTLAKVAGTPDRLFAGNKTDPKAAAAPFIAPLLNDLIRDETWIAGAQGDGATEWTLAVRLAQDRRGEWQGNLPKALAVFGVGPAAAAGGAESFPTQAFTGKPGAGRFQFAQAGEWFVLGWRDKGALSGFSAALAAVREKRHPGTPLKETWAAIDIDLTHLPQPFVKPAGLPWARAQLQFVGHGANVRTTGRLVLSEPAKGRLEEWAVPTNTIREPLVSFTAFRGISSWLQDQPWFRQADIGPAPGQAYAFAQSLTPFQTYFTWRVPDLTNQLQKASAKLPALAKSTFTNIALGSVNWQPKFTQVIWEGLPILVPYIRPALSPESDYVVAGVFPTTFTNKPPAPAGLVSQLRSAKDLVYYDWELTQTRVLDWRNLFGFYSMISGYEPMSSQNVAVAWVGDTNVTSSLGNAVTQARLVGPSEISVQRTSSIGLTGFEIVSLSYWLGNTEFPSYAPPKMVQGKRKGAKGATTVPVPPSPAR